MEQELIHQDEKRFDPEDIFYILLDQEEQARLALEEAERALLERQNQASHPSADDEIVEAFSRWLKTGRKAIFEARAYLETITLERDLVRQALLGHNESETDQVKLGSLEDGEAVLACPEERTQQDGSCRVQR